jgi:hypothetical protein
MYGERTFNLFDSLIIKDKKNNLYCEIIFNPDKKTGFKGLFGGSNKHGDYNPNSRVDYFEGVISNNENIDYRRHRGKLA